MRGKSYTFFIASTPGKLRKVIVPTYILHGIAVLALIGAISVTVAVGSYSRMLWKVSNYNALRHDQETLKKQYRQLQTTVNDTNQRLDSLQSLATEVAMTYGVLRYHPAAFDQSDNPIDAQDAFDRSIEQYTFLKRNASVIAVSSGGLHLLSAMSFANSSYTPAIWPVMGQISAGCGERLDPFSGEGASTAERTKALAEASRDVAHDRPDRRRVTGIGKTHGGQQMESAAGDSNHRGIALQEGVLLDRAVERVLRVNRIIALVESGGMVAQHAVGHGHFGRERLEGIEPLVGVVHGALELPVLLLEGFLVMAEGVVVADLPEHSGVRADGYCYADCPNEG